MEAQLPQEEEFPEEDAWDGGWDPYMNHDLVCYIRTCVWMYIVCLWITPHFSPILWFVSNLSKKLHLHANQHYYILGRQGFTGGYVSSKCYFVPDCVWKDLKFKIFLGGGGTGPQTPLHGTNANASVLMHGSTTLLSPFPYPANNRTSMKPCQVMSLVSVESL